MVLKNGYLYNNIGSILLEHLWWPNFIHSYTTLGTYYKYIPTSCIALGLQVMLKKTIPHIPALFFLLGIYN